MVRIRIPDDGDARRGGHDLNSEIVAVGTELLLGQIANTNAQTISDALASIGVNVYYHSVVGDNLDRMTEVLKQAISRSDCVVVTGGLGPTPDDITREAIAAVADQPLVRDEEFGERLRSFFEGRGRTMPESNLRQADFPAGATVIEAEGTAPGFHLEIGDAIVFAVPGVPWEMRAMLQKTIVPLLRARAGDLVTLSREVMVIGLGESHTHEKIADIVEAQTNPTIAYLAGAGRVRVRLTAQAVSESAAIVLIEPVEHEIRERLGEDAVAGNHSSLAEALGKLLRERGATVGVAESLTGGSLGAELTEANGSSEFFVGSLVVYSVEAKKRVAEVDPAILEGPGPVSEDAARALAEGAARVLGADLGLSTTGVAGPAEHDGEPVGTIYVGASWGGRTEARLVKGYGDRTNIRAIAATSALDLGRRMLTRE
jgi:nicotinamide-nucleotide amidase